MGLKSGTLLVTGPRKFNGVPLRRVNQKMCIATSTKIDVSKVKADAVSDEYFARKKRQVYKNGKKTETEFYSQDNYEKVKPTDAQKKMQAAIDGAIKVDAMTQMYLKTCFAISNKDQPHLMKF